MRDPRRTQRATRRFDGNPLAYLISFRCHGTWLHGDPRGSVDPGHNLPGTPTLAPNAALEQWEAERLRHEPVLLDSPRRQVVERAIRATCAHRQ